MPQFGILGRSPVGLLVWYGGDDNAKNIVNKQYPGSRLKTPALPIWVIDSFKNLISIEMKTC